MSESERRELQTFIDDFRDFMEQVVHPGEFLSTEQADELSDAFRELVERGIFESVRSELDNAELDNPEGPSGVSRLERLGLTGANLRMKLSGWRRARERLRESFNRRSLRRVFRWANTILGSIAAAVGAAEALKELKEAAENSYEDTADEAG